MAKKQDSDRTGRKERLRKKLARLRRPFLEKFYSDELSSIIPGDFEFNLQLLVADGVRPVGLDTVVEDFGWEEDDEVMTGSVSLRRPDPTEPASLPIATGMRIRCRVRWANRRKWYILWTMRVAPPDTDAVAGQVAISLEDDLVALKRNKRWWSFRSTKKKDHWTVDQIARRVARKEGLRLGRVIKGQAQIKKLEGEMYGLDVLRKALEKEKEWTGAKYIIRMRNGLLEIVPYRRNPVLYVLGRAITAAGLTEEQKGRPVTSIVARGRIGKGSGAKKLEREIVVPSVVRQWGYVAKEKNYGQVDSMAALVRKAKRDLAEELRVKRTAELEFPGIPFIRRGDGCRWMNREPGWHGPSKTSRDRTFIYCDRIAHSVGPAGDYRTNGTFVQEDPYVEDSVKTFRKMRAQRRANRRSRGDN